MSFLSRRIVSSRRLVHFRETRYPDLRSPQFSLLQPSLLPIFHLTYPLREYRKIPTLWQPLFGERPHHTFLHCWKASPEQAWLAQVQRSITSSCPATIPWPTISGTTTFSETSCSLRPMKPPSLIPRKRLVQKFQQSLSPYQRRHAPSLLACEF